MPVATSKRSCIRINVGGQLFVLRWRAVKKFPNSRLEQLCRAISETEILSLCDEYDAQTGECFFDRHPKSFENVWNLLQSGQFYFDTEMCAESVLDELHYWGVSMNHLPFCCRYKFDRKKELIDEECEKVHAIMRQFEMSQIKSKAICGKQRAKLWSIMEQPETSILARVMAATSIIFIIVSTVCLVVSTVPELQKVIKLDSRETEGIDTRNDTVNSHQETMQNDLFEIIEHVCITWFTFEYILRLISAPRMLRFFIEFLNIIDVIAIAPFYFTLIVTNIYKSHSDKLESISKVVQVFRILRILRVLKLARHSVGLQSLGYTLQKSYKELGLLVSFIAMGVSVFSSLLYFAEKETNHLMFPSIPETFWWSIISMTTVGYGDVYPQTTLGQTLASICCVTGVLVIAMPIPIIVSNFSEFYKDKLRVEKTLTKKEELEKVKIFAQNTIDIIQPFLRTTRYTPPRPVVRSSHEVWNTHDWKFIDYSSSETESSSDDNQIAICKSSDLI